MLCGSIFAVSGVWNECESHPQYVIVHCINIDIGSGGGEGGGGGGGLATSLL